MAACRLIDRKTVPVIVRELDDDAAVILMVDSNQQRENLLPSEKAFAYQMKLEAMKRQGKKIETTSRQVVGRLERADTVGDESGRTIQRYIRLTYLEENILKMVDEGKIAFGPAVEISFLKHDEQCMLLETILTEECTPSLSQAQTIKSFSLDGKLDMDTILTIMSEQKGNQIDRLRLREDKLREFFPANYTPRQMEEVILQLLAQWRGTNQKSK